MNIVDLINGCSETAFSFEILPPMKGADSGKLFRDIEELLEFNPKYINITSHRSEVEFRTLPNGLFEQVSVRHRPGTVAIAAAIQNKYKVPVVPHVICSGFSKSETEYALIDLHYLGITNLLVLRGDRAKNEKNFKAQADGHSHANELQQQVNDFNRGRFIDGSEFEAPKVPFSYGVAGYPEKHEESPNAESDIFWLKEKVKAGADYIVTQMFYDNSKYFSFVEKCRQEGITVPIIPGLKPITSPTQLSVLPRVFHIDLPETLASELRKCTTKETAVQLGIEWCTAQSEELKKAGVPSIHFYSMNAVNSVKRIAEKIY